MPENVLTFEFLRDVMDRVDGIARPWRDLVGQCKLMPSSLAPDDGTAYVLDMEQPYKRYDIGFPPMRFRMPHDPRYLVVAQPHGLQLITREFHRNGIRDRDIPAAVVYLCLQKAEAERRRKAAEQDGGR